MPRTITDTCDICGSTKGATNHWWILIQYNVGLLTQKWDEGTAAEGNDEQQFACGETCVIKAVSAFLNKQP